MENSLLWMTSTFALKHHVPAKLFSPDLHVTAHSHTTASNPESLTQHPFSDMHTSDWMIVVGVCHNITTTQYTLPPGYQLGNNDPLLYITK